MVAIDTETNGQEIRDGRGYATGVSIAWEGTALYLPFRHPDTENCYSINDFREPLQAIVDQKRVAYFNAKFDIPSLGTLGVRAGDDANYFYCTQVLAHLLDEDRPYAGKFLNNCVAMYCPGEEPKKMTKDLEFLIKMFGWGEVPAVEMSEYATHDAYLTYRLYQQLKPLLIKEKLGEVWKHKMDFLKLVIKMEGMGILLDQELCREMAALGHEEMENITDHLGEKPTGKALERMLINELGLPYIYKSRKNGTSTPTFDSAALDEYDIILARTDNTMAKYILAYRGWQKATSSNYESYLEFVSPDGRLRPNYRHDKVRTGRMSCEKPNLQQIPRSGKKPWNGKMKACFIASPGYQLWEVDYSQLELRLGTAYADEPTLKQVFLEGRDIFTEMSLILEMSRQDTKTEVYSIQYGAGVNRISFVFGVSKARASEMIADYYRQFPNFRVIKDKVKRYAERDRKVMLWSGRYRHFIDPAKTSYKAFNSVIQGGAADIVERTMLRLSRAGYNDGIKHRMLLQVHDSVVFELRDDMVETAIPGIIACMENVNEDFDFGVKFAVEAKKWGT